MDTWSSKLYRLDVASVPVVWGMGEGVCDCRMESDMTDPPIPPYVVRGIAGGLKGGLWVELRSPNRLPEGLCMRMPLLSLRNEACLLNSPGGSLVPMS